MVAGYISIFRQLDVHIVSVFMLDCSCFIALLIVAAVLWKIKQRYDRYRRRQRLFVEMEQMASRPFGSVLVEMERLPESSSKEVKRDNDGQFSELWFWLL